jgi:hypothetical protein
VEYATLRLETIMNVSDTPAAIRVDSGANGGRVPFGLLLSFSRVHRSRAVGLIRISGCSRSTPL